MRRAQSVRHYGRPSLALGADDLGMLKEHPEESAEDALRRQLLETDRENDKVNGLTCITEHLLELDISGLYTAADSNSVATSAASTATSSGNCAGLGKGVHQFGNSSSRYTARE